MIAGGSGDGQQVLVVVASVVEHEVAGELEKTHRGRGVNGDGDDDAFCLFLQKQKIALKPYVLSKSMENLETRSVCALQKP